MTLRPPSPAPKHFAYIDAVRGLAFLGVLLCHVSQRNGHFPGSWIWNDGSYGVQFFFLASAITLCYSMESRKSKDRHLLRSFFIRRLFRIGPMYWLAILLYWCLPFECLRNDWLKGYSGEAGPAPLAFALNALFLNAWAPSAFNSIVPGGWSVGVEMTFYFIFPILFFLINSLNRAALGVILGASFSMIYFSKLGPYCQAHFYYDNMTPWFFTQFCFPAQLTVFLIGIFAYHLLRNENFMDLINSKTRYARLLIASLLILASLLRGGSSGFVPLQVLVVIALAGIILALSGQTMTWIVNPGLCYLGKISFSCYLVHFAALSLVLHGFHLDSSMFEQVGGSISLHNLFTGVTVMAVTLLITVGMSTLTFHLIENPGIALGQRLIDSLNKTS